jgi:SAM-dependent methyltransferase
MSEAANTLQQLTDLHHGAFVAVTLKIAEHISSGHQQLDGLAREAQCDAYVLQAMLRHLVNKGVFVETQPGTFANNDVSKLLVDPGWRIGLHLDGIGGRMAHAWGTMLEYVMTGEPAYSQRFGLPFWEDLNAHPEVSASFDALIGPTGHGTPDANFEIPGGWEQVTTVADVGGGTGTMLAAILRLHPNLQNSIDMPATVARSKNTFDSTGIAERVRTSGQSFFDPLPRGADVYYLKNIINDWPDKDTMALLKRCAEAARPNGRVILLSGVSPDGTRSPLTIEMVLLAGKHRSLGEFRELATTAGLEVTSAEHSGRYFVVECRPT